MKRLGLLVFFALACPLVAAAQEMVVTGIVTTREDGLPLPGATVSIASLSLSAVTDPSGRFVINLPPGTPLDKPLELRVSSAGLLPKVRSFKPTAGTVEQDFALALTFSEEITVGSRTIGLEAEGAVPVDVLTSRQIEATGATETMQVIQRLAPSFNFPRTTIADGSASVRPASLRGLGPDQVLVLINGKRRQFVVVAFVRWVLLPRAGDPEGGDLHPLGVTDRQHAAGALEIAATDSGVEDPLREEPALHDGSGPVGRHDVGDAGAGQRAGGSGYREIPTGVQVGDVDIRQARLDSAGQAERRENLPAIRQAVRQIGKCADIEASRTRVRRVR